MSDSIENNEQEDGDAVHRYARSMVSSLRSELYQLLQNELAVSSHQRALLYDTFGLIEGANDGLLTGNSRIRDNLIEFMKLFGESSPTAEIEATVRQILTTGGCIGLTSDRSGKDEQEKDGFWQSRQQR